MRAPTHSRSVSDPRTASVSDMQATHDWVVITHHGRTATVVSRPMTTLALAGDQRRKTRSGRCESVDQGRDGTGANTDITISSPKRPRTQADSRSLPSTVKPAA